MESRGQNPTGEMFSAEYAVLIPDKEERLFSVARRMYAGVRPGGLEDAAVEEVAAALALANPGIGSTVTPGTPLILPAQVGNFVLFQETPKVVRPELPKTPPKAVDEPTAPPSGDIPYPQDQHWDIGKATVIDKGQDLKGETCTAHYENVVEKDGTQEKRIPAGSYVYVRRGSAPTQKSSAGPSRSSITR